MLVKPLWALARLLFLPGQNTDADYNQYNDAKRTFLEKGGLRKFHEVLIMSDYFLQVLFKVTIPLILGTNLICDRYLYDTIVSDLGPDLGYSPEKVQYKLEKYFRIIPKPDLVFLIDVPETVSLARKSDIPASEYLSERKIAYATIASNHKVVALDGTLSLEQLKIEVIKTVRQHFV